MYGCIKLEFPNGAIGIKKPNWFIINDLGSVVRGLWLLKKFMSTFRKMEL